MPGVGSELRNAVYSDVVMRGMNCGELVARLLETRPHTRVIFMSGYAEAPGVDLNLAGWGIRYLQKPFSVLQLAQNLREALDASLP